MRGAIPRSSTTSEGSNLASRNGVSALSASCAFWSGTISAVVFPLPRLVAFCSAESTTCKSASNSSPRTSASSAAG